MKRLLPLLALALGTCRGGAAGGGREEIVALMGGIDARLMAIQQAAGDPIDPPAIRRELAALRRNLERARREGLEDHFREAVETVASLEGGDWTADNRADRYGELRRLCSGCHAEVAPPVADGRRMPSSWESCGRCHEKAYREWEGTLHANAWTDPVYRMSAGNPPKMDCRSCHSMEPILERAISTDAGYRPVFRPYNHEEGVNCLACHGLGDGSVAAARDLPDAPCRPRRDPRLRSSEFCGACHNPTHGAYDEWKASKSEKSCADCHARPAGAFTHRMLGVHDAAFVKGAVGWTCAIRDGELTVELTNKSGHVLPAEVPSRTLRIGIRRDDAVEEIFLRRPPKAAVGSRDTRLQPNEVRRIRRSVAGARQVRVEIRFQRSPFERPEDWVEIGVWESRP